MANLAHPQIVINYISQRKKIIVNKNNQPSQLIIQTDYNLNETYNFQIINAINQVVQLDSQTTYQLYGSYIDSKNQVHILFYTLDVTPRDNMLSFLVNTFNSQYLAYVKSNRTPIEISIVAKKGNSSYMVLRDNALANPRGYVEGQAPTEIVYQNIFNVNIPVTGSFAAGNNIDLAQDYQGQDVGSFAFGDNLTTSNQNQFVIGYNNDEDATKAFIIANDGNIFTVDLSGNIEAGDLDVGAISATSIYINGEEVGTQVDQKLEATSAWVNETFETKDASTSAYNALEQDISDVDSKVDNLSSVMTANYATKVELGAVADAIPSKVSELENDSKYVTSAVVDGYATEQWVLDKQYITSSEIPTDYVTNGQLDEAISSFITIEDVPVYTGASGIGIDSNHVVSITGQVGEIYTADEVTLTLSDQNQFSIKSVREKITAGDGISLSTNADTGVTTISIFGSATPGEAVQYYEGTGISIDNYTISINQNWLDAQIPTKVSQLNNDLAFVPSSYLATYATKAEIPTVPTNVGAFTNDVGYLTAHQSLADYYTKTQTDSAIETATTDMATKTWVGQQGYLVQASLADYATKTYVDSSISGFAEQDTLISVSGTLADSIALKANSADVYTKTEVDNAITAATSTFITEADIPTKVSDFENDSLYVTSGELTGALNAYTKTDDLTNYISTNILTGFVSNQQLEAKEYATTGAVDTASTSILNTLTSDYATKTSVTSEIEAASTSIENWADAKFLTEHQSLSDYYTKSEVDSAIGTATTDMATETWVSGQISGKANAADVYTIAEANAAIEAATSGKANSSSLNNYYTKTEADNKFLTGHQSLNNYYTKSQVYTKDETDTEIYAATSGAASKTWVNNQGFAKTADLPTVPTKVSELQNDAGYLTSIPSEYVTQTELTAKGYLTAVPSEYITQNELSTELTGYAKTTDIPSVEGFATEADLQIVSAAIPTSYLTSSDIEDMATETWVGQQGYITSDDLTDYALKSQIPDVSDLATKTEATYTGSGAVVVEDNVISLTGELGKTYTGGTLIEVTTGNVINFTGTIPSIEGLASETFVTNSIEAATSSLATEADLQIVSAAIPSVQGLATEQYVDSAIETASGNLQTAINGKTTSGEVKTQIEAYGYQTATDVANAISGKVDEDQLTAYYTKTEADNKFLTEHQDLSDYAKTVDVTSAIETASASIISQFPSVQGLASQTYVGEQINGISATISTNYALKSELPSIEGLATEEDLQAVSAAVPTSYVVPSTLNDYATTAQINYVSSVVSTLPTENTTYTAGTGLKLDGTEFSLTASIPTVSTYVAGSNISITSSGTNEYTVAATDTTYAEGTGVTISGATNIIAVDQEWLEGFVANLGYLPVSSNLDVVADEETIVMSVDGGRVLSVNTTWLNNVIDGKGFLTAVPVADKEAISGAAVTSAKNYVDDKLTAYALSTDVYNKTEVYTKTEADDKFLTAHQDLTAYAQKTWVEGNFLTGTMSSTINSNTERIGALETASSSFATAEDLTSLSSATSGLPARVQTLQNANYQNATQVSGIVEGYNYATNTTVNGIDERVSANETAITNLSSTKIDATSASGIASGVVQNYITVSGLATENYVNGQIAQIPAAAEYTAGTGLQRVFENDKYVFNLTGTVLTGGTDIEVSGKSINFTGHIPTDVSELTNDANYATSAYVDEVCGIVEDWVGQQGFLTEHQDLTDYATTGLLSSTSATLTTSIKAVDDKFSGYTTTTDLASIYQTKADTSTLCGQLSAAISGKANSTDVYSKTSADARFMPLTTVIPTVPTNVSQFTNDAGYISSVTFTSYDDEWNEVIIPATGVFVDNNYFKISQGEEDNQVSLTFKGLKITDTESNEYIANQIGWGDEFTVVYNSSGDDRFVSISLATPIPSAISDLTNDSDFVTSNDVATQITNTVDATYVGNLGFATTSDLSTASGNAILTANAYTDTVSTAISQTIQALPVPTAYTAGTGLKLDGTEFSLTASIPTVSTYVAGTNISITPTETANELEIAFTGTIPTVSSYVASTGIKIEAASTANTYNVAFDNSEFGFITTNDIPTNVSQFTNDATYISASQLQAVSGDLTGLLSSTSGTLNTAIQTVDNKFSGYYTTEQVVPSTSAAMYSAISGDVDRQITGKGYITGIENNALLSDVTTAINGISATISTNYTTSDQASAIASAVTTGYLTNYATTGSVNAVATGLAELSTSVDNLNIPTEQTVTGWVSAAGFKTTDTTYTAGEGLKLEGTEFSLTASIPTGLASWDAATNSAYVRNQGFALTSEIKTYKAGEGLALSSDNQTFYLTGGGGGGTVNLIAGNRIRLTQVGDPPSTRIDVLDYTISAANTATFNFDWRLAPQTSSILYSYEGIQPVTVSFNPALPNGVAATVDSATSSVVFIATSGATVENGTSVVSATIIADDAQEAVVQTTINTVGKVIAEITGSNQTMSMNFATESSYISSFTYGYNGTASESLNVTLTNLPQGVTATSSYANGTITVTLSGSTETIMGNGNKNVSVKMIANDTVETIFTIAVEISGIEIKIPLALTAKNGSGSVKLKVFSGTPSAVTVKYSTDGGTTWSDYTIGDTISLAENQTVLLSGNNDHFSTGAFDTYSFEMTGQIEASGNVMSLMNFSNTCTDNCFNTLFMGCSSLKTAPQLPATTLAYNCYRDMFNNCTSLSTAPQLPAPTLANSCYNSMFRGCTALTSITVAFTDWNSSQYCTGYWLNNSNAQQRNGQFHCPAGLPVERDNNSRIPENWTVINDV